jgi:hypothetical protein
VEVNTSRNYHNINTTYNFIMMNPSLSYGVSSRGSQFYSMGNPLHKVHSFGGNAYSHVSNPYNVALSSQETSLMPLYPFINQLGGGHYPTR